MIGLASVSDLTDADKPIGIETQSTLNLKIDYASLSEAVAGLGNADNTSETNEPIII